MVELAVEMRDSSQTQFRGAAFPDSFPSGDFDVLTGKIVITQPLRVRPNAEPGEARLRGALAFQVCNNEICLPPDQIPFRADITIER